jgi:hypothetical protein
VGAILPLQAEFFYNNKEWQKAGALIHDCALLLVQTSEMLKMVLSFLDIYGHLLVASCLYTGL